MTWIWDERFFFYKLFIYLFFETNNKFRAQGRGERREAAAAVAAAGQPRLSMCPPFHFIFFIFFV